MYPYQPANYGSRLPVSPEHPDQRNMVSATPILRIDLGQMTPFTEPLIDALVIEIQNNVGKNATRTFAFNLWGQQGFENQVFADLLSVFAQHCELIAVTQQADPVAVAKGEAPFFLNAAMGMLVEQFPELTQYLPPDAEGVIRAAQQDWHQLTRNLRAAQTQWSRSSFQGTGGGYPQGAMAAGYQRGMPVGGNMGLNGMRGAQAAQPMAPRAEPRPIWAQQAPQAAAGGAPLGNKGFNGNYTSAAPAPAYQPTQRSTVTPEPVTVTATGKAPPPTARFDEKPRLITPNEKPVNPTQPNAVTSASPAPPKSSPQGPGMFDRVRLSDGSEMIAAIKSPYKVAWSPERPPQAFDRERFTLFHYLPAQVEEGQVTLQETVQDKGDGMEYLDHELDEALKRIYRAQGELGRRSGAPEMAALTRIVPNESGKVGTIVSAERLQALDEVKAPRVLKEEIVADSIEGAIAEAHLEILRHGGNGKVMEFLLKECKEYCLEKGAYSKVLALKRCRTYEELLDQLLEIGLEHPDSALMDLCNERLTRVFNRFLTKSLYFNWTIDNLIEDYPSAREKIASSCGDILNAQFTRSVRYVIDQALCVLDEEQLEIWFARHLPENDIEAFDEPVVFANPQSVTTVPWTMYELEKRFRLEGLVTKERALDLHEALEAIFLRTTDPSLPSDAQTALKLREHVLVTSDGHRLYARAAYLSPQLLDFSVTLEHPVVIPPREARA